MKQAFEHKHISSYSDIDEELRNHEQDGWELVAATGENGFHKQPHLFFKRPVDTSDPYFSGTGPK